MWLRATARVAVWAPALLGIAVAVVAWRCRTDTRLLWVKTGEHVGYVQITPRHVDAACWRRFEYDPAGHRAPLWSHNKLALFTTTEPTPAEPAATTEKIADANVAWHAVGFGLVKGNDFWPQTPSQREAWVPTWFVVAAAFAPLVMGQLFRRRRRKTA
jgi:hypothetical protein